VGIPGTSNEFIRFSLINILPIAIKYCTTQHCNRKPGNFTGITFYLKGWRKDEPYKKYKTYKRSIQSLSLELCVLSLVGR
jgi:hypothetical protein